MSKKGRERVLKEKVKNIHAYVDGTICKPSKRYREAFTYNPYKYDSFVKLLELPYIEGGYVQSYLPVNKAHDVFMQVVNKKPSQFLSEF